MVTRDVVDRLQIAPQQVLSSEKERLSLVVMDPLELRRVVRRKRRMHPGIQHKRFKWEYNGMIRFLFLILQLGSRFMN